MFRLVVALSVLCLALGSPDSLNDDRIVNGRTGSIMEFPYQVSLQEDGRGHFCGGSVLNEKFVLTAAHCLIDMCQSGSVFGLTVRVGSGTWASGGQLKNAQRVFCHPSYDPKSMVFDIAVLEIEGKFVYSASVKPITLLKRPIGSGLNVVVSGWGKLGENIDQLPSTLQAVTLTSLSPQDCASGRYSYRSAIKETMMCAVGPMKDSCQGDSGGPLNIEHSSTQVGVVSWGLGCAQPGLPGVYCDLAHPEVLKFIKIFHPSI